MRILHNDIMKLSSKSLFYLLVVVLGIGLNLIGKSSYAVAQPNSLTTATVSPVPAVINGCETVAVEIWVNDVAGLYGADVQLTFDPDVVEVQDDDPVKSGVQVQHGGFLKADFVLYNSADNSTGTLRYTITQLNPSLPANGSGKLLVMHLRGKSLGVSAVHFSKVELANRDAGIIPVSPVDGSVTVNSPSAPTLSIAKLNATDARLSWTSVSGVSEYHLYRGTTPYFTAAEPPYRTTSATQSDDAGVLGNPATNYFYTVKAVCPNGSASQVSNRVGEFDFALVRNASNAVALPLIDSSLQTADDLGLATGSSKVSEWVAETSSFRTRLVGIVGPDFTLQTAHGYFVRTKAAPTPTVFTTVGRVPDAGSVSFSIYRQTSCKLNLLSLPLDHPELSNALQLATSIGGVPKVSEWIAATNSFRTYIVNIGPINFSTRIGYPYWPCANTSGGGSVWP